MTPVSRRQLITAATAGVGGVAAGLGLAATSSDDQAAAPSGGEVVHGRATIPFHGAHQAGIATPAPAHATFLGLDLRPGVTREGVVRLLRLLSDDAARLTRGEPALGDTEPELALAPARLTVTFGFGPALFDRIARPQQRPASVAVLPGFTTDRLQERWSGGDLVLQICSDDPMTVVHAVRMLVKDARGLATIRWTQRGFRTARGTDPAGTTVRNLLGQIDGTVNPVPGTAAFDAAVWAPGPGWFAGGSVLVLRRVALNLETWDAFDRSGKELAMGRRLDTGAPLTGTTEKDVPDLDAVDAQGFFVIDDVAHIRLAKATSAAETLFRRGYNYDEGPTAQGQADVGLVFAAYQANADTAFVPVQRRLAAKDAMNRWLSHVGSAVFAVPPGCAAGEYVGQALLEG